MHRKRAISASCDCNCYSGKRDVGEKALQCHIVTSGCDGRAPVIAISSCDSKMIREFLFLRNEAIRCHQQLRFRSFGARRLQDKGRRVAKLRSVWPEFLSTPNPESAQFGNFTNTNASRIKSHREMKGRFRKRVGFGECALVPVFVPGKHANVPSFRFSFRGNICQKHLFGNHPFRFPTKKGGEFGFDIGLADIKPRILLQDCSSFQKQAS